MNGFILSNTTVFDKDHNSTFAFQDEYKSFGVSNGISTQINMFKEVLEDVIGAKVDEIFQDFGLSNSETEMIKEKFEQKINDLIPKRELVKPYYQNLTWNGNNYNLNMSIESVNNRLIWDFYTIVTICEDCLNGDKTMYLTIE